MTLDDPPDNGLASKMNSGQDGRDKKQRTAQPGQPKGSSKDIQEMVLQSIRALKDRKGSSLMDIRKYMIQEYSLNKDDVNDDIKKYLRRARKDGTLSLSDGKYKVKTTRRRRSRRRSKKTAKKGKKRSRRRRRSKSRGRSRRRKGGAKGTSRKGKRRSRRRRSTKRRK